MAKKINLYKLRKCKMFSFELFNKSSLQYILRNQKMKLNQANMAITPPIGVKFLNIRLAVIA